MLQSNGCQLIVAGEPSSFGAMNTNMNRANHMESKHSDVPHASARLDRRLTASELAAQALKSSTPIHKSTQPVQRFVGWSGRWNPIGLAIVGGMNLQMAGLDLFRDGQHALSSMHTLMAAMFLAMAILGQRRLTHRPTP